MIVGRFDFSLRAAADALPMRDAFAVLFFVSVGMLFDPRIGPETPWLVAGDLAIILVGKPLAAFAIMSSARHPREAALRSARALAQIGEFSFILATLAATGCFPVEATNTIVAPRSCRSSSTRCCTARSRRCQRRLGASRAPRELASIAARSAAAPLYS